jgi:hypothetical protein
VIDVAELTTTLVAAEAPNLTLAPVTKFVPVIVTLVLPAGGPPTGFNAVTVGGPKAKWSFSVVAEVPPAVLTVRSTVPVPAGETAVIEVLELTTTPLAAAVPNVTLAPAAKFVPVIVTLVAPAVGPLFGLNALTVGSAT